MIADPFFFLIDFEQEKPIIYPLAEIAKLGLFVQMPGMDNLADLPEAIKTKALPTLQWQTFPLPFETYLQGFKTVQQAIQLGNSYLLNLTYPTLLKTNYSLSQLFLATQAPYKLWYQDHFVCFSPECFVRIKGNTIYSYPMKGTMNAEQAEAKQQLLASEKELWEHYTIVDLIRNDLAMVASNIQVDRFRYCEKIITERGAIWQTSSEIKGELSSEWRQDPLQILTKLLPAGSISGAPKQKTLEIIQQAEQQKRGYYTGIFGYFDGENLESAVIIRYIEQQNEALYFRSGGGITAQSQAAVEYNELLEKVYLPLKKIIK
ncbi:aminodeoxychorismate synthase component I [Mergibacter septicus]|uniref:aminodeoxychorismate synthase component I n=1 Tax=Mergibacter septicus TaxID=221402 RepID=UPI001178D563|nr:aminodeoxychorismate synthase component I [Mergibacter septicus]AWX14482.1 aminodeoxychorismate synthase component I [Mergibacter septicus]